MSAKSFFVSGACMVACLGGCAAAGSSYRPGYVSGTVYRQDASGNLHPYNAASVVCDGEHGDRTRSNAQGRYRCDVAHGNDYFITAEGSAEYAPGYEEAKATETGVNPILVLIRNGDYARIIAQASAAERGKHCRAARQAQNAEAIRIAC